MTPEFHQSSENWKQPSAAAQHPGIIKEAPIGGGGGGGGPTTRNTTVNFVPQGQSQGAVMMVYGLDGQISNTEKLFNLVCLYGNVARVGATNFRRNSAGLVPIIIITQLSADKILENQRGNGDGADGRLGGRGEMCSTFE